MTKKSDRFLEMEIDRDRDRDRDRNRHRIFVVWIYKLGLTPAICGESWLMEGEVVGFSASLQPNQNAYTKVIQSKAAEFRPHICTCPGQIG